MDILEIIASVLAVFGAYTLLDMLRLALLYPRRDRMKLHAAFFLGDGDASKAAAYARRLRLDKKISSGRLIILVKDDIIIGKDDISPFGDVYTIIRCKENTEDGIGNK